MPYLVTLLYPVDATATASTKPFDLNYYLTSHMPMVFSKWGPRGLVKWEVAKLDPAAGNEIQCNLYWESKEKYEAAGQVSEEVTHIFGDIPNYATVQPAMYAGEVVGTS